MQQTLWQLVEAAAAERPEARVLSDDHGRTLTRLQLRDSAERVAAGLVEHGVRAGTLVSWQVPTTIEAFVLMLALARLGAVQNPIIPALREREVGFITRQIGTELFITPPTWRGFEHGKLAAQLAASNGFRVLEIDLSGLESVAPGELRLPVGDPAGLPPAPTEDGERWRYYTSGTTADPKGARHFDRTLIASASGMIDNAGFGDGDDYPIAWPITHIGGVAMLVIGLRTTFHLVLFDEFDVERTPLRMAAHGPTIVGTAVPFFRAFVGAQLRQPEAPLFPRLRIGAFGGAPVPAEVHDEMREAFGVPLVGAWGLTEFPVATSASPSDSADVLLTSVGRPSPGVQVRSMREDGTECATGEEGELQLRGPQCFAGYTDPALDAAAFADGWFRTGDLGTIDEAGCVRITGRLKDIIIRNAENISVIEIEEALHRHPDIAEAAVFGLPDRRTGERVVAAVVPRGDARPDVVSIRDHCVGLGLAKHKCPEQVELVSVLPRNAMGKVLKHEIVANLGRS